MTRNEAKELLISLGIESPETAQVSALLNGIKASTDKSIEDAVKQAKEETEANIRKEYEGYVSSDDHNKVVNELSTLKDSNAKQLRYAKFKEKGIAEKWYEHADSTIGKEEKDYDKRLEDYIKNNPELMVKKEEPKEEHLPFKFGGTQSEAKSQLSNQTINDFIRGKN